MRLLIMKRPKYIARIDNIYFLAPIGKLLRSATQDVARAALRLTIKQLLARLDGMELKEKRRSSALNDN